MQLLLLRLRIHPGPRTSDPATGATVSALSGLMAQTFQVRPLFGTKGFENWILVILFINSELAAEIYRRGGADML